VRPHSDYRSIVRRDSVVKDVSAPRQPAEATWLSWQTFLLLTKSVARDRQAGDGGQRGRGDRCRGYRSGMAVLLEAIAWLLVLAAAPVVLLAAVVGRRRRLPRTRWRRGRAPVPTPRTLEVVAADVRRISIRFHQDGMRFAQYEGRRQAYDRALTEVAAMLEVPHLLAVLPAGPDLDDERRRVETVLAGYGVLLGPWPGAEPRQA
jgi:hypothetical protein